MERDPLCDHTHAAPSPSPWTVRPLQAQGRGLPSEGGRRRRWLWGPRPRRPVSEAAPVGVRVGGPGPRPAGASAPPPGRLFSPGGAGALAPARLWAQSGEAPAPPAGDPRQLTDRLQSTPRGARGSTAGLGPPHTCPARRPTPAPPTLAQLLTVTLGCISLLYLQLPGSAVPRPGPEPTAHATQVSRSRPPWLPGQEVDAQAPPAAAPRTANWGNPLRLLGLTC